MAATEKDGDDKDKKREPPSERSWTGVSSVWEFQAAMVLSSIEEAGGRDAVATELPKYLTEATLGLRGGPGDGKQKDSLAQEVTRSTSQRSVTTVDMRVRVLREMLEKRSCVTTGTALFWLVISGIFHCVPEQVRDASRTSLGESWQAFRLEIAQCLKHDMGTKNWVISALPFLYAQAIFRLFFDGFPDDRHAVISNDHNFMNNIVLVIHFELMGFQINLDTAKKLRRSLFLPRVLQRPHVNQDDYLRGQRRQAELEMQALGTRPLKFGHLDAPRPDEIQLEHVLQGRSEMLSGKTSAWISQSVSMFSNKTREKELVPPDLSVDRYLQLSAQGMLMLDRQMSEMEHIMTGAEPEVDELQGGLDLDLDLIDESGRGDSALADVVSNCPSPFARGVSSNNLSFFGDDDDDFTDDLSPLSPCSRLSPDDGDMLASPVGKRAARVRRARMAGQLTTMQKKATERREEEAKMKRQRQELLEQKLKADQLPDELTRTELNTTWVSPGMKSLFVDAKDRDVMHKTRCESFGLKMSQSSTLITSPSSPLMKSSCSSRSVNFGDTGGSKEDGDRREITKRGSTLARVGGETLLLEPPANLSAKVVYGRLETALKTSQTLSFANYTKEYDVFTGDLKQRFDEERLRAEEAAYLKKMKGLVGERGDKTKKLLYPGGELNRRSRSSPASRRLG